MLRTVWCLTSAIRGIGSPEQPDLIQRGPATAEGGCERQRALVLKVCHWRGARPEHSEGGAIHDSATRYDCRAFGVALAGGIC